MRRAAALLALLAAGLYLAILLGLFAFQRQFVFEPRPGPSEPAEAGLGGFELAWFLSADGLDIPFWRHPADDPGAPLVLYFHGNAGGLHFFTEPLRRLAEQGYAVAAMEYRGYPGAPGKPSEADLVADAEVFARTLAAEQPHRPIVLWGYSLGSGVATQLAAASDDERVLVLEAPFTAARDIAQARYPFLPVRWLMRDPFDSLARIGAVGSAVFVMHGERDRVVPFVHGERLFAAAGPPKDRIFLAGGDHANLDSLGAYAAAFGFIRAHAGAAP